MPYRAAPSYETELTRGSERPDPFACIQAELAAAEQEWQEWTIACQRVRVLLSAPDDAGIADEAPAPPTAKQQSQVPVWRKGLAWSALSVGYQCILKTLGDRSRLGQGSRTCQEMAALFGMDVVPARVEVLRSKAKRLVARLAGRIGAGPVHVRAGRERIGRRLMSRIIDQ